ncbi:hypothetical protein BC826DRAFT_926274, partial [Russula brevipes]
PCPIPNSYWATPLLVACKYPWMPLRANQLQKIDQLLRAGMRTSIQHFAVFLMYAPHLAVHVVCLGIAQSKVEYHSFPIADHCLPRLVGYVRQILDVLKDNACRRRINAMHCRSGIGHMGLIISCWLVKSGAVIVLGKFGLCLKLISDTEVLSDRFALKFWNHHPP